MASLSIEPWYSIYHEMAENDFSWSEEGLTKQNLRTYRYKPGYGNGFAVYGFRGGLGGTLRINEAMPDEGPHVAFSTMVFRPNINQGIGVSSASLFIQGTIGSNLNIKIFGILTDDFQEHQIEMYPTTYRQEYHSSVWGRYRRYRCDTDEWTQEHTQAITRLTTTGASPLIIDVKNIVNEILARPGWQARNRMGLAIYPDYATPVAPYLPDLGPSTMTYSPQGSYHTGWFDTTSTPSQRARLEITY